MNKIVLFLISCFMFNGVYAQFQQFGSTRTIERGFFEIGGNPFIMIHKGDNPYGHKYFGFNAIGGYGITGKTDFRLTAGLLVDNVDKLPPKDYTKNNPYFGIGFEHNFISTGTRLKKGFDLNGNAGVHSWKGHAGFDAGLKIAYRKGRRFYAFSGLDFDLNFSTTFNSGIASRTSYTSYRIPLGLEILPSQFITIVLETDIPLSETDHYVAGGGLRFFLNK